MANVFTKTNRIPRTTTLRDFGGRSKELSEIISLPCMRSPTRTANPHPKGLVYQCRDGKSKYGIWNPNYSRLKRFLPIKMDHLRWVNFSCGPLVISPKMRGGNTSAIAQCDVQEAHQEKGQNRRDSKPPNIQYTENTISRSSYKNPMEYPSIYPNMKTTRYGYTPQTKPARGIVPNIKPPEYKAVEYRFFGEV